MAAGIASTGVEAIPAAMTPSRPSSETDGLQRLCLCREVQEGSAP